MSLLFDHAIVLINNLPAAIKDYRELGFTVKENNNSSASIQFVNGTSIELMTVNELKKLELKNLIRKHEGLVGYALRLDNFEREIAHLQKAGFKVRKLAPVEYKLNDGEMRLRNRAVIKDNPELILIEAVNRKNADITTPANRAVGLTGVEILVRKIAPAREKYARLFRENPETYARMYRSSDAVILREVMPEMAEFTQRELPDYLSLFAGNVSQSEIDSAEASKEPKLFEIMRDQDAKMRANFRASSEREQEKISALGRNAEVLFQLYLVREQAMSEDFTLIRTHNVRFQQLTGAPHTRGKDILVGLDGVNWGQVHHAYGAATDVPELLHALASDDKTVRRDAYEILEGSIVHQGTVYEASLEAIPFLMQLLDSPEVADKDQLLYLLEGIVFGGDYEPSLRERTHTLLRDALPVYLRAFNSPESKIREMVAEHLALYKDQVAEVEPHLRENIFSDAEVRVRAASLQTLFALWAGEVRNEAPDKLSVEQIDFFAALLRDPNQAIAVRYQAASALIKTNPERWLEEGLSVLYTMMKNDQDVLKTLSHGWIGAIFYSVVRTLADYPEKALEWVAAQAEHPMAEIREHVATALNQMRQTTRLESEMMPTLKILLQDKSPEVRQSAVGFFYFNPQAHEVVDMLEAIAANDPSLQIRTVARNTLKNMPPKPAE